MKCAACGAEASGKFCSSCGSPLRGRRCRSCGADVAPGTRFCTACGAAQEKAGKEAGNGGAPSSGSPSVAWWVAGGLLVVVLVALGYPILTRDDGQIGGSGMPAGAAPGTETQGLVDLTTMPLEDQGTRLFNRVMSSNSVGDTADVEFFLPKALVIYEQLDPQDPDGIYHYALLHQVGGDFEAALAKSREGLAQVPDYLLLLAVAAESSLALGDTGAARESYRRFLDLYDAELELMRPGYEHHMTILPVYRDEARAFLGSG